MSKFLHYQFDENGVCFSVAELHSVVSAPDVVFESEVKKLTKEEKAAAKDKLGKKKKAKLKAGKVAWDVV